MALDLKEQFLGMLNDGHSIFLNETFIYANGYQDKELAPLMPNDVVYEIHNISSDFGEFSMIVHKEDLNTLELDEEGSTWTIDAYDGFGNQTGFRIQFIETSMIAIDINHP